MPIEHIGHRLWLHYPCAPLGLWSCSDVWGEVVQLSSIAALSHWCGMESAIDTEASPMVHGRGLYELHCAACHGSYGQGSYIGPLAAPPPIAGRPPQLVKVQVRRGLG